MPKTFDGLCIKECSKSSEMILKFVVLLFNASKLFETLADYRTDFKIFQQLKFDIKTAEKLLLLSETKCILLGLVVYIDI